MNLSCSRITFFLLSLFCPAHILRAGEPEIIGFSESQSRLTQPHATVAATAGTQGFGMSIGYRFNPYIGVRLRGATIGYDSTEIWGDQTARLNINGDNAGLLIDIYPFGGNFYLTAGLTYCESTMRYRTHIHRGGIGSECHFTMGGEEYELREDTDGELSGKYGWDKLQPYIGIGYTDTIIDGYPLYYSIDLGINYMGSGKFSTSNRGEFWRKDSVSGLLEEATDEQLNAAVRREGHDFFKFAERLRVYPVLQLSVGLQF